MDAVVVHESIYGNTRLVAEAIADGIGPDASVVRLEEYTYADVDLLVIGGPTHPSAHHASAGETDGPVMRGWLRVMPPTAAHLAATFCTCVDGEAKAATPACEVIARRLAGHGMDVIGSETFFLDSIEGPLRGGELERAREFGAQIAHAVSARLVQV